MIHTYIMTILIQPRALCCLVVTPWLANDTNIEHFLLCDKLTSVTDRGCHFCFGSLLLMRKVLHVSLPDV